MGGIFIVIPAYNEASTIGKVIKGVQAEGYRDLIVVDDGSRDKTPKIAAGLNTQVISHVINRGQGAAIKTGIDYALKKKADIIVTFDADGQFRADEIKTVVAPVREKSADIVLGSRFLGTAKDIPFMKRLTLKLGIFVVKVLYGIQVTDSQNGFRAISAEAAEKLRISSNRMEHAGEIFSEIMKNGLRYVEVPVTVIYTTYSRKKGQSWSKSVKLGMKMLLKRLVS